MRIAITGSSGLIGSSIYSFFKAQGDEVFKIVRENSKKTQQDEILWNPYKDEIDLNNLEKMDAVIHLSGETIAGRWTTEKKKKIYESRVATTKFLSRAISQLKNPPSVFICASAVGYYGNQGENTLTEKSPNGKGFLSDLCVDWEEATRSAVEKGVRTVNLRFGVVLSEKGGALKKMLIPFKLGLGGCMGSGSQYMSWIALEDLISIIDFVLKTTHLAGPINAVSPHPVTNLEFTKTLARLLDRPAFFNIPSFVIKVIFGEMGEEVILSSTRAVPEKLTVEQFLFKYPFLEQALEKALKKS